jgi:membrane protein implicated in regulation of membrane protease activity
MTKPDAVVPGRSVWRILAATLAPLAGAIACTVGCVAFPVVAVTISAACVGFVRIGLLLILLAVLSIAFVRRGLRRVRERSAEAPPAGHVCG